MPYLMEDSTHPELWFDVAVHSVGLPAGVAGAIVLEHCTLHARERAKHCLWRTTHAAGVRK